MKDKLAGFFFLAILYIGSISAQCTKIKDYGPVSTSIESLYNRYVNLLTDAGLTINGDEPGVNLFFGGMLSQQLRKLKYYGNSVTTFMEIVVHHICREHGLTPEQVIHCLQHSNLTADYFDVCEQYDAVDCSKLLTSYQPVDGVCVNHDHPYQGAINTPYRRLLKNTYDDAIHEVRSSEHDDDLPSARLISTGLRTLSLPIELDTNENQINDFVSFFAAMTIFDIAKTLKAQTWNGNYGFECCDCDGTEMPSRFKNRHCMPIEIPERDPVFRGKRCMNYIRSMVTHDNCQFKQSSIVNTVTHFMDMDFIYVPNTVRLALKNGGKFNESAISLHKVVILGDERSAAWPQFYAIAIVWFKFHNRVFDELTRLYPHLPTDVRFYEARRFVIALYQNIFYSEVLPLIVSPKMSAKYRLLSRKPCYDPKVDPSVIAEFTASAGRYLHTFIQNNYTVNFKNGSTVDILLRNFDDPSLGYHELAGVLTGTMGRPWNTLDIAEEPSNYYATSNGGPGLDLRAIDIQTERDFGLGTYCDALYYFNLTEGECIKKFSDFEPFITENNIEFLKYAYESPCDVDFGVGASMHSAQDGDLLSDIVDRIFAIQFQNLKCGDPFFFSNALPKDQIAVLDHISFKNVLCYTIPGLRPIQPFVFLTPGENNTIEACEGSLNLQGWKLSTNPEHPVTNLPTQPPEYLHEFFLPSDKARK